MASQEFAATTIVSEKLINSCLTTYLANLANPKTANISRTLPITVNGTALRVSLDAQFAFISAKASLQSNAQQIVSVTFRLYADASVFVFKRQFPPVPIATFDPAIVLSLSVVAPIVAQIVGNQFQLGVNLLAASITSLTLDMVDPALPPPYKSAIDAALADPSFAQTLTAAMHSLTATGILPATTTMVPAFYDITMQRPLIPAQQWFSVRVQVSQVVVHVRDGRIAVGVNVAPFTAAPPNALFDVLPPDEDRDRRKTVDVLTIANLQFLEDFLNAAVFPVMRNEFIAQGLRLNQVTGFTFKTIGTRVGFREGLEMKLHLTYWTDEFFHFVVAGTTAVDVQVTLRAYLNLKYGRLYFIVNDLDIQLPPWVTLATLAVTCILPPFSFAVPILFDKLMHDTAADVLNGVNGAPYKNALEIDQEVILPQTAGPPYSFKHALGGVSIDTRPPNKGFSIIGNFGPVPRATPRLTCSVEGTSADIPPGLSKYELSKIGELPGFIIVDLFVPPGLVHPRDPSVRVRWEVLLNGKPVPTAGRDVRLREQDAKKLRVIPILFTNPLKTDQEISVLCRLYRPLGSSTEEFLNQRINILSVDPRPDELKPYVQWSHWVQFWNGYKWVDRLRLSKIHKTPGKGGCKFSNQYRNVALRRKFKFDSIRHMVDLPLPLELKNIEAHRDLVCPYCFFGGPDKHPGNAVLQTVDLASRKVGRNSGP